MTDTTAFPAPQPPSYGPSAAPASPPPTAAFGAPAAPQRTRLRDLLFGWRSALAVLLAGVIVGGLVGASITLLIDHHGNGGNGPAGQGGGTGFGQRFGGFGQGAPDGSGAGGTNGSGGAGSAGGTSEFGGGVPQQGFGQFG
jgi:hypothetical protein